LEKDFEFKKGKNLIETCRKNNFSLFEDSFQQEIPLSSVKKNRGRATLKKFSLLGISHPPCEKEWSARDFSSFAFSEI